MTPKVSVVVPVYNPGATIEPLIRSLLRQSLAPGEFEVVFVDDGSTDATPARLDALASEHEHIRVRRIENSGWPGRPRNIGIDLSRGDYVYFVDNDDWIGKEALERLVAMAERDDADIVVGKVVGGPGKLVPRALFAQNRTGVTLEWGPLVWLLTPHKLFRRSFLLEHALRFPEGRRRLEDHLFVLHAYFLAERISILADYPCYQWVPHDDDVNASFSLFDPAIYYENVRDVLDVVDEHTEPGPFRDRLYARWYRGKLLGRMGGHMLLNRPPEHRRARHEEIRKLALERFGPGVDAQLPFNMRLRSALLREGTYEALEALAEVEAGLRGQIKLLDQRQEDGQLVVSLRAHLEVHGRPLRFERRGDRLLFPAPPLVREHVSERALDVTDDLQKGELDLFVRAARGKDEYVVPAEVELRLEPDGEDGVLPVLLAQARIDPAKGAAGAPLRKVRWRLLGQVGAAGFRTNARVRRSPTSEGFTIRVFEDGTAAEDAPSWRRRLARRLPGLVKLVRRVRSGGTTSAPA